MPDPVGRPGPALRPPHGRPAVVIAGGPRVSLELVRKSLAAGDFLLCTDSGGTVAVRLGVLPDLLLGDFDSLPPGDARWLEERGCPRWQFPVEKDKTDLELALDHLLAAGAGDVTVTGALGGRFDHSLANLNLLSRFEARGLRVGLDDGSERAFLVRPGEVARIEGRPGLTVSLFSATPRCRGITLTGFKYPLSAATLAHGSTLGVSNQLVAPAGTVTLTAGRLIVVVADLAGT